MASKYKFFIAGIIFLGMATLAISAVNAADDSVLSAGEMNDSETEQALSESANLDNTLEPLDGIEVAETKGIPSAFGFWWRNVREWISVGLTIDPVKKAEKQLKFAEERARLADYIIENSEDSKIQGKAQKMLEKANEYMKKIEDRKTNLTDKTDEESQRLLKNIAKHYLNKERILEKIEDKLPPEKLEEFQQMRQKMEERNKNFLDKLGNNPNISQEAKDKITNVLSQSEDIKKVRDEFRAQQKSILEEIKAGNSDARKKLEELREEKKQEAEKVREQFKDQKTEIINKIREGEEGAVMELKKLNKEQQKEALKLRESIKSKATEIKKEIQQKRQEGLQKIKELNVEKNQETEAMREELKQKAEELRNELRIKQEEKLKEAQELKMQDGQPNENTGSIAN